MSRPAAGSTGSSAGRTAQGAGGTTEPTDCVRSGAGGDVTTRSPKSTRRMPRLRFPSTNSYPLVESLAEFLAVLGSSGLGCGSRRYNLAVVVAVVAVRVGAGGRRAIWPCGRRRCRAFRRCETCYSSHSEVAAGAAFSLFSCAWALRIRSATCRTEKAQHKWFTSRRRMINFSRQRMRIRWATMKNFSQTAGTISLTHISRLLRRSRISKLGASAIARNSWAAHSSEAGGSAALT